MIKIIGLGAILFGLSATASYFFLTPTPEDVVDNGSELEQGEVIEEPKDLTGGVFPEPPVALVEDTAKPEALPVTATPAESMSFDVLTQMSESIKKNERLLFEREKTITREENRLAIMFDDIKREQKELQDFAARIDQKTLVARQLLDELRKERDALATQKSEIAAMQKKADSQAGDQPGADNEGISKAQSWLQELDPEVAANAVRTMADSGQLKMITKVLQGMEQRKVAEILAALDDEVLAKQILELTIQGN
ncbi:MAG: hypothetical protein R3C03_15650 [Pirellulaceae bacterium]